VIFARTRRRRLSRLWGFVMTVIAGPRSLRNDTRMSS
jgi:hypothetical protein